MNQREMPLMEAAVVPTRDLSPAAGRPLKSGTPEPAGPSSKPARSALWTRERYLFVLTWAFTLFSSVRVLSYLPTLWLIVQEQNASQHSLLTWCTWLGGNLTMAGWLHEHNGRRMNRAVLVNLANAGMSAATVAAIIWFRL